MKYGLRGGPACSPNVSTGGVCRACQATMASSPTSQKQWWRQWKAGWPCRAGPEQWFLTGLLLQVKKLMAWQQLISYFSRDPLGQSYTPYPLGKLCVFWLPSTFPILEMLPILLPTAHVGCPLLRELPRHVLIRSGFFHASTFLSALCILTHLILTRLLGGECYYYYPILQMWKLWHRLVKWL